MACTYYEAPGSFKPRADDAAVKQANEEIRAAFEATFAWPLEAIALAIENRGLREEIERLKGGPV